MKCENPICKKEVTLLFRLKNGVCVCENCAIISSMSLKEIEEIKKEAEIV